MPDCDVFKNAGPPDFGVSREPGQYDLRLRPGFVAVAAGCVLPNVNDD
jgi:hypothetical protein